MLSDLLSTTITIKRKNSIFNGLGNETSSYSIVETVKGRIRQISNRNQYKVQGNESIAMFRAIVQGGDHPYIEADNILNDGVNDYKIINVDTSSTINNIHHLEIDCQKVSGI